MDGAAVTDLARRALGRDVELVGRIVRDDSKHSVWRLRDTLTGETLIAKIGLAPTPDRAHHIDDEHAALTFLASFPRTPAVRGALPEARLLLLEDLGEGPTPLDLLNEGSADAATDALVAAAKTMGELHRATRNRGRQWTGWRAGFGPPPDSGRLFREPWPDVRAVLSQAEIEAAVHGYAEVCRSVGVSAAPGFEGEIALVAQTIEHDIGRFGCLAAGDQNVPAQFILKSGEAWAIDFDACGYRHALIDGASIRALWAAVERVPEPVLATLERTYREAFAPEPGMDYGRHHRLALARWHVLHVVHRLPWAIDGDFMRSARTSLRQQALVWLETFGEADGPETPALGWTSAELHARLKCRWPELPPVPFYPAYG